MPLKNIEKLNEKIYRTLKKSIVEGDFYPGEKIVERDIAQLLKVSRTPVREALQKLEAEHLVQKSHKGGVIITKLDREEIRQLYTIRIELEILAVKWATEKIKPHELKRIAPYIDKLEKHGEKGEWDKAAAYNRKFHEAIAKASGCSLLVSVLGILKNHIQQAISKGLKVKGAFDVTVKEHWEIYEAIDKKNAELAATLMQKHLEQACLNVLSQIQ